MQEVLSRLKASRDDITRAIQTIESVDGQLQNLFKAQTATATPRKPRAARKPRQAKTPVQKAPEAQNGAQNGKRAGRKPDPAFLAAVRQATEGLDAPTPVAIADVLRERDAVLATKPKSMLAKRIERCLAYLG